MSYTVVVLHCRSREATEDYRRQRRFAESCRTPHSLTSMVECSVDLHTRMVECCRNGSVAFTAGQGAPSECYVSNAARYNANGQPGKQSSY